jgi:ADP-ribose pyrophosphatase YjhB (NUDIX family)
MAADDTDPDTEVRTWREDGEFRRERVSYADDEEWDAARERIDDGLEWGVGALVERDGEVLLVKQEGRWLLPGGEVEDGESHAEALVRELDEETGVAIAPGERLAVVRNVVREAGGTGERSFQFAIHRATAVDGETTDDPGLADEDIEALAWYGTLPAETLDRDLLVRLRGG